MALELELQMKEETNLTQVASTQLNVCAILSGLNKHEDAASVAETAVSNLLEAVKAARLKIEDSKKSESLESTLSVAYYNLGVELEFLGKEEYAVKAWKRAKYYSKDGNFNLKVTESINAVIQKMEAR